MLNLKKGLALVLAAATAFTFAPVANLGQAVEAEAADVNTDVTLNKADKWGNDSTKVTKEISLPAGVWQLEGDADTTKAADQNKIKVSANYKDATTPSIDLWDGTGKQHDLEVYFADADKTVKTVFTFSTGKASEDTTKTGAGNGTYTFTLKKVSEVKNRTTTASAVASTSVVNRNLNLDGVYTFTITVSDVKDNAVKAPTNSGAVLKDSNKKTEYGNTFYKMQVGSTYASDSEYENFTATDASKSDTAFSVDGSNRYWSFSTTGYVAVEGYKFPGSSDSAADNYKKGIIRLKAVSAGTDTLTATLYSQTAGVVTRLATASYKIKVAGNTHNIDTLYWQNVGEKITYYKGLYESPSADYGTTYKPAGFKDDQIKNGSASETPDDTVSLNTLFNKTLQLNYHASGASTTFISSNPKVFTVSQDGLISAVGAGTATLRIVALPDATGTYALQEAVVRVVVTNHADDVITATYNDNDVNTDTNPSSQIDLDPVTSKSSTAVTTAQIDAKSLAGSNLSYQLVADKGSTAAYGDSSIASVDSTGKVTAGSKVGTVFVRISSPDSQNGAVKGKTIFVKIVVNTLPQADITNLPESIRLDLSKNKTATLAPTTTVTNAIFTFIPNDDANKIVTVNGNTKTATVTAKDHGYGKITVAVPATATSRYTTKDVAVAVVDNAAKAVSDLKVASSALTVKVGDTASAGASTTASGAAITYTSSDTDVATVAADGTITAVAPGTAVVTVKAAETDTVNTGTATIVVTVPSNPAKVTGLKVSNKKGAYVSVKWTSQGSNVNYRIYKKVGKGKWVGKNVAGNKATLSVKKGAKVQVKVKSYVKDASGKTTWGPAATKAKTFKTDKK